MMGALEDILRRTMPGKDVLQADEAAAYLGVSVSRLHTLCSQRAITHYRTGRCTYFRKADLEAYMCSGERRDAVQDILQTLHNNNLKIKQQWKKESKRMTA